MPGHSLKRLERWWVKWSSVTSPYVHRSHASVSHDEHDLDADPILIGSMKRGRRGGTHRATKEPEAMWPPAVDYGSPGAATPPGTAG